MQVCAVCAQLSTLSAPIASVVLAALAAMAWRYNLSGTAWHPQHPTTNNSAAAAAPPPGWTKTPLFLEITALKQQVSTLAAENARLSGLAQESTETCGHLSKEVGRLKQAFSALADLVDA